MNIHLAKILVKENIVSLDQIRAAFEEQRRTGKGLGEVLVGLGYINESQLVDFLSREHGVPVVNLDEFEIEAVVLKLVARKTVLEHGLIPIGRLGSTLVVAMSDPSNIIAVDDLRFATGFNIKPVVAPERAIKDAIGKHYGMNEVGEIVKTERDEERLEEIIKELEDFKNSVHQDSGASLSQDDEFEKGWEEGESEASQEKEVLTPNGLFSHGHESDRQEDAVLESVEEEVVVNPFVAPSSSQNYEVAGGQEEVSFEKVQDDGFDPGGLFFEEYEPQQQPEEVSLEARQEEKLLKKTTLFSQSFESLQRIEDINTDVALELVQEKEANEQFITSSSQEDELREQKGEVSPEVLEENEVFKPSSLFSETNTFEASFSPEPLEREEKQQDSPTVFLLHRETNPPVSSEPQEEKEQTFRQTILVVDDSPTIQKIVAITLERNGYQVVTASNATQALAKLNEVLPNLIFLDINLPHMDGYQVCKIIKANDLTKDIPVVMLSGKDGFFDKVRGRLAGATDYITKPFEPSTLIRAVEKYSEQDNRTVIK